MEIKIYYRDTDCGGVVYYANYLDYFERARTEWMEERGASVRELRDRGIQFIVKHSEVDYRSPAAYGQVIVVDTKADKITGASIDFSYRITEKGTDRIIVTGSTLLVCIDGKLKPRRIPEDIASKLTSVK
ncbi:MAG: YbgC/FadM family acyl-CoA thioesterase [Elusimicrobia bacterium]|nr:YbgC/FadM family acyl-CoA thioesterase [Elusimicrobiota bacterium]